MGKGQEGQKEDLLTTFSMAEAEWAEYNVNTQPIFSSPNSAAAGTIEVDALDQRLLRKNPLKHAAIEAVAEYPSYGRSTRSSAASPSSFPLLLFSLHSRNSGSERLRLPPNLTHPLHALRTMHLLHYGAPPLPRLRTLFPPP